MSDISTSIFNGLPWHDALLVELGIDRRRPGESDEVSLLIEWPCGRRSYVRFVKCYAMQASMNFGIIALESIRSADEYSESEGLEAVRASWRGGIDLGELRHFRIETSSTASTFDIYALDWIETHLESSESPVPPRREIR